MERGEGAGGADGSIKTHLRELVNRQALQRLLDEFVNVSNPMSNANSATAIENFVYASETMATESTRPCSKPAPWRVTGACLVCRRGRSSSAEH